MRHLAGQQPDNQPQDRSDWTTAIAIALAILICLAAFIWIFLRLDPYLSDFVSDDDPATPATEGSPTSSVPFESSHVPLLYFEHHIARATSPVHNHSF
jgi:hypothetical protein